VEKEQQLSLFSEETRPNTGLVQPSPLPPSISTLPQHVLPPAGTENGEIIVAGDLETLRMLCQQCRKCPLAAHRTQVVFGEGNPQARILLLGEGPGKNEDASGRPFVGAAGQLLDKILESVGFQRENVFIANVVKCRPPQNRLPTSEEVLACKPYLSAQIRLIDPYVIVCLGALATQTLIDPRARITAVRGQWYQNDNRWLIPTFHPAALLRDATKKRPVWEDFKEIRRRFDQAAKGG